MQKQINALREAFSVDTSRPFELKPGLLGGSPGITTMPSPPLDTRYQMPMLSRKTSPQDIAQTMSFHGGPMTPPMTADLEAPTNGSLSSLSSGVLPTAQQNHTSNMQAAWNPAPIFEYVSPSLLPFTKSQANKILRGWNAAFGENSASMAEVSATVSQQSPPIYHPTSLGNLNPPYLSNNNLQQQPYSIPPSIPPLPQQKNPVQMPTSSTAGEPSFVTSSMWRDSLANTWDRSGLKRGWDTQDSYFGDPVQTKRSR